jgi:hypothetical protein
MDLVELGSLHSLHQEVRPHPVEKRAMLGHKDLFPLDRQVLMIFGKVIVSISAATALVLRIEKASCPIRPAVMSLQLLEAITSPNVTNQMLLQIYLLEVHPHLWTMRAQTL